MRRKFGGFLIVLGTALILSALALFLYNQRQDDMAGDTSVNLLPQLLEEIQQREALSPTPTGEPPSLDEAFAMTEVVIDGYAYIGYLTIPALDLELPILSGWDNKRLQIAPCRYTGTLKEGNLVLMAHNFKKHFGRLSELTEGDSISFMDMDGVVTYYSVVAFDILDPYAVEEMTAGVYDLTLFTCTYGGQNRVTVYCDRMSG